MISKTFKNMESRTSKPKICISHLSNKQKMRADKECNKNFLLCPTKHALLIKLVAWNANGAQLIL